MAGAWDITSDGAVDDRGNPMPMGAFGPRPVDQMPPGAMMAGGPKPAVKPQMPEGMPDVPADSEFSHPGLAKLGKLIGDDEAAKLVLHAGQIQMDGLKQQPKSGAEIMANILGPTLGGIGSVLATYYPGGTEHGKAGIEGVNAVVNRNHQATQDLMKQQADILKTISGAAITQGVNSINLKRQRELSNGIIQGGSEAGGTSPAKAPAGIQAITPGQPTGFQSAAPMPVERTELPAPGQGAAPATASAPSARSEPRPNAQGLVIPPRELDPLEQEAAKYARIQSEGLRLGSETAAKHGEVGLKELHERPRYKMLAEQRAEEAKRGGKLYDELAKTERSANELAPLVEIFKHATEQANKEGVPTGALSQYKVDAAKIAKSIGVDPRLIGLSDNVSYNELLAKISTKMTAGGMADLPGARAAAIVKMVKEAQGGSDMTLEGNRLLGAQLDDHIGHARSRADLARKFKKTEHYLDDRFDPLLSEHDQKAALAAVEPIAKQAEASKTEKADKAAARAESKAAASGPPRVASPDDLAKLPPGSQYMAPDGKVRIKPADAPYDRGISGAF